MKIKSLTPGMKKWLMGVGSTAFIIIIIVIGFILISKTALGKALVKAFGAVAGPILTVTKQFDICQKEGLFNANKGCYVGLFGVVVGIMIILSWVAHFMIARANNPNIEKLSAIQDKPISEIMSQLASDCVKIIEEANKTAKESADKEAKAEDAKRKADDAKRNAKENPSSENNNKATQTQKDYEEAAQEAAEIAVNNDSIIKEAAINVKFENLIHKILVNEINNNPGQVSSGREQLIAEATVVTNSRTNQFVEDAQSELEAENKDNLDVKEEVNRFSELIPEIY